MAMKKDNLNCECLRPDVEIQGDCTPPVIDIDTADAEISYNNLINKPEINGMIVKGNHNGDYYGLVDKTILPNQVYATDDDGLPTTIPYSEEADSEYIVRRDENGDVIVPLEPGKDNAATSKKYVDDLVDAALEEATVFKGVVDDQTQLPTTGNRNGDMYWIRAFVEPAPEGMIVGHSGTAIYNGTLQEFQFESDEIYDPDLKSIIFDNENKLAVQLSNAEDNIIQFTENGLYASTTELEQELQDEIERATAAEEQLQTNIEAETARATAAEEQLNSDILAEATAREANDEILDGKIDTVASNLTQEIADRQSADETLQTNIEAETQARSDADEGLQDQIGNLEELDTDNKDTIVGAINEIFEQYGDSLNELNGRIDDEITARENADSDLSDAIEAETERAEGVEGDLENLTTTEKTNLVGAINELNTNKVDANAAITGATHTKITYDSKGLVTGGSDITLSDVTDITATTSEVNQLHSSGIETADLTKLHNVTADANELNILDGATLTTTELNYVDGVTSSIQGQIGDLTSLTTDAKGSLQAAINEVDSHADTNASNISDIQDLIPAQATSQNQLADKEFVNSSVATNTGNFIGTFNSIAERDAYQGTLTNNDYCFVISTDGVGNTVYNRYKWTTATTPASWVFEYALNNSSFTADQWAAINSNATTTNIAQITTNKNAIGTLSNLTTTAKTDVVSAINEINSSKQDNITGAATTITSSNLTVDRAVISNASGKVAVSETTSTELSYVHGVTSSIQPQINSKANIIFEDWTV